MSNIRKTPRNRVTTLFRLILMIPVVVVAALASMGAGLLFVATVLMILVPQ